MYTPGWRVTTKAASLLPLGEGEGADLVGNLGGVSSVGIVAPVVLGEDRCGGTHGKDFELRIGDRAGNVVGRGGKGGTDNPDEQRLRPFSRYHESGDHDVVTRAGETAVGNVDQPRRRRVAIGVVEFDNADAAGVVFVAGDHGVLASAEINEQPPIWESNWGDQRIGTAYLAHLQFPPSFIR